MDLHRGRRHLYLIALITTVAIVVACQGLQLGLIDDTYIFLQYARNLAEGHGAVFNLGEYVEGFSSPLWTFLVAGAGMLLNDFEAASWWLALACTVGTAITSLFGLQLVGGQRDSMLQWVIGLGLGTSPLLLFAAGSGMDSAAFAWSVVAVLVSILCDFRTDRLSWRTGLLMLIAALVRPEGLILAVFVSLWCMGRRNTLPVLGSFYVAVGLLFIVRFVYYGSWIPNTAHAKVAFAFPHRFRNGMAYLGLGFRALWPLLFLGLFLTGAAVYHKRVKPAADPNRRGPSALSHAQGFRFAVGLLAGWAAVVVVYSLYVGGDNLPGLRFLLPALPAAIMALGAVTMALRARASSSGRWVLLSILAAALAACNLLTFQTTSRGFYGNMSLAKAWSKVGRWIHQNTPPDAVVATPVPGAMGFFGRRTTIDMLGLTDRVVASQGRVYPGGAHGHARYHTDYIFERQPDLVIYLSSGRSAQPLYANPERIHLPTAYCLYDFVTDPRCAERYSYATAALDDGTWVEMLRLTKGLNDAGSRRADRGSQSPSHAHDHGQTEPNQ